MSILRARMEGGRFAAGFVREADTIRKDPGQCVQESIAAVFTAFREAGTARQGGVLLRDREFSLPVGVSLITPAVSSCGGRPPVAEPCGFSRTRPGRRLCLRAASRARGRRRDTPLLAVEEQWEVLLPERHEGYVDWRMA